MQRLTYFLIATFNPLPSASAFRLGAPTRLGIRWGVSKPRTMAGPRRTPRFDGSLQRAAPDRQGTVFPFPACHLPTSTNRADSCDQPAAELEPGHRLCFDEPRTRIVTRDGRPRAKISVVLLVYNALRYTRLCVSSLQATTGVGHELVVVDNASRLPTRLFLVGSLLRKKIHRLCLLDRNTYFAEGNNVGAALGSRDTTHIL